MKPWVYTEEEAEAFDVDGFLDRIAKREDIDIESAFVRAGRIRRARPGQVEDLIAQLDPLLHPPLRRGLSSATPGGRRMALEEFLRRVAAREGADVDEVGLMGQISGHVRAVLATLAEAVSDKEWFDVTAELPAEYDSVIPPR
jgi:uncharacterized protein (DUF2267 family)